MIKLRDLEIYQEGKQYMARLGIKNPVEWIDSVHQEYPMLDKLYEAGSFEKYETMISLLGVSYEKYHTQATSSSVIIPILRKTMPGLLASQIVGVQPMTGLVGQILKI